MRRSRLILHSDRLALPVVLVSHRPRCGRVGLLVEQGVAVVDVGALRRGHSVRPGGHLVARGGIQCPQGHLVPVVVVDELRGLIDADAGAAPRLIVLDQCDAPAGLIEHCLGMMP